MGGELVVDRKRQLSRVGLRTSSGSAMEVLSLGIGSQRTGTPRSKLVGILTRCLGRAFSISGFVWARCQFSNSSVSDGG